MQTIINIKATFPKHLFWDMDYSKLSFKKDKNIIIPRALFATTKETFTKDITLLETVYSKTDILKYLKTTQERISNEVCLMVAEKYKVTPFYRFKL